MANFNISNIIRQDYEPSKNTETKVSTDIQPSVGAYGCTSIDDDIKELKERITELERTQDNLVKIIHRLHDLVYVTISTKDSLLKDINDSLQKSKDEYIAALQCEMEITRMHLVREIYKRDTSYIKGNHGDPFK